MSGIDAPSQPASAGAGRRRWLFWTIFLLVLGGVYLYASRPRPSAVVWTDDFKAGLAKAAETNQLVLLDFSATWCGYCEAMDREVFSRQDVADALAGWVPIKLDVDRHRALAVQYGVRGPPAFIVLSPAGEVVSRLPGAVPAEAFLQWITSVEDARAKATQPQ